jgi:hypothetical protein
LSVVSIDGKPVGNGHPGEVTIKLRAAYFAHLGLKDGSFL